jgi:putative tricarboxylic transport membrane protein
MDILDFLHFGLEVFTLNNVLWLVLGSIVGVILGALPGLSPTIGIAIFIPITFNLEPATALIVLGAIYVLGSYGGNITAILINTPGTSDSFFMTFDGYPMTVRGEGLRAIGITTVSAFIGGIIGTMLLVFIAPPIALFAVKFGPLEKFLTMTMGLVIIIALSKDKMFKGFISTCVGFLCSMVGLDIVTGLPRFTFGIDQIYEGLPLVPVVLGIFAISQVFCLIAERSESIAIDRSDMRGSVFLELRDFISMGINNIRASIIGFIVGVIPGAGTTVAAGISYDLAKKGDPHPETFGKGNEQGLASVSAANNAVVGGSLVPLLTLGIPGNGTAAVFLGGLYIHGLAPGTRLFTQNIKEVYSLFWGLIIAQFLILVFGMYGAPIYEKVTRVANSIVVPIVTVFCVLGAYVFRYQIFDILLIIFFGLIGYYIRRANILIIPFILAYILGRSAEMELRRALYLMEGRALSVIMKPLPLFLLAIDLLFLISPFWNDIKKYLKGRKELSNVK